MKHCLFLRILSPWGGYGGIDKHILDWFKSVNYEKNKITLVATKDAYSKRLKEYCLPVEVIELPHFSSHNKLIRFYNFYDFFKKFHPDTIVFMRGSFNSFSLSDFLAGFIVTKGNIYAYEAVGAPVPLKSISKLKLSILSNTIKGWLCKKVLTASNEVRERLTKWYYYPEYKTVPVFHGVDLNIFSPNVEIKQKMRKHFNISENDIVIISTSRLCKEKCIDRLIIAFDVLYKRYENIFLFLLGKGPLEKELKELSVTKQSSNKIKFLGYQEDVSNFLKMSDIFVLPSEIEGLSISMLEAMATGLITVATEVPGPKEIIKDRVNGFLVERSDEGILRGLIKALDLNKKQRKEISFDARRYVKENFEIEKRVKQTLEIFGLD